VESGGIETFEKSVDPPRRVVVDDGAVVLFNVDPSDVVEFCPREGVMVRLLFRLGLLRNIFSGRSVPPSFPSCVAAPSRSSWMKYGPHLLATSREFTGMRSPPTQRISISEISLRLSAA